jgi:hypothetical protein
MVLFRLILAVLTLAIQVLPRGSESHAHATPHQGVVAVHDALAHVHTERGLGVSHEHNTPPSPAAADDENSTAYLRAGDVGHESDAFYFVSSCTPPLSPTLGGDHTARIVAVATCWGQMLAEEHGPPARLILARRTQLALTPPPFSILLRTSALLI